MHRRYFCSAQTLLDESMSDMRSHWRCYLGLAVGLSTFSCCFLAGTVQVVVRKGRQVAATAQGGDRQTEKCPMTRQIGAVLSWSSGGTALVRM